MARVVIIGAGIVGLSVARAALKRGHEVHLLEQGEVPNPHSASYDQHRMIRYHYGAAVGYTRMVAPAFEAWSRVWDDIGSEQFEDTGAIAISLEAGDYAAQTLEAFREIGIPHEVLDRAGVERLCPHLQLPEGAWGVVAFPGGPLFAGRIVTDLARWVAAHGAVVEGGCRIARVDQERGVAVRADGSTVEGDILVVAAGAWLPALMPERYGDAVHLAPGPVLCRAAGALRPVLAGRAGHRHPRRPCRLHPAGPPRRRPQARPWPAPAPRPAGGRRLRLRPRHRGRGDPGAVPALSP